MTTTKVVAGEDQVSVCDLMILLRFHRHEG
jgi:hypothetical protein